MTASSRLASDLCSCHMAVRWLSTATHYSHPHHVVCWLLWKDKSGNEGEETTGTHCHVVLESFWCRPLCWGVQIVNSEIPLCMEPDSVKTQAQRAKQYKEFLCRSINAPRLLISIFSMDFFHTKRCRGRSGTPGRHRKKHSAAWAVFTVPISSRETTVGGSGFSAYLFGLALHIMHTTVWEVLMQMKGSQ